MRVEGVAGGATQTLSQDQIEFMEILRGEQVAHGDWKRMEDANLFSESYIVFQKEAVHAKVKIFFIGKYGKIQFSKSTGNVKFTSKIKT